MKAVPFLVALTWVALSPLVTLAADLTKIDRTIKKEPAYRSKSPNYCLLVFGPEVKFRVWLVFDGDILYVDRNGNGDLTEPNKRLEPSEKPIQQSLVRALAYAVGVIQDPTTGKKYTQVKIHRAVINPDLPPEPRKTRSAWPTSGRRIRSSWKGGSPESMSAVVTARLARSAHCGVQPTRARRASFILTGLWHLRWSMA
jgi:hypothetical protein